MNISKKLPSRFEAVPAFIHTAMEQLTKELPITEEDHFDVKLALEEALTNAIKHGNKLNSAYMVDVVLKLEGDRLEIRVSNQGGGFDHTRIPDPTSQDKLMRTSGRGVFLMKKIMDEVSFHDQGREIRMVKIFKNHR